MSGINKKEFEKIARAIAPKERATLWEHRKDQAYINEKMETAKGAMKRDIWIGLPWMACYFFSNYMFGMTYGTIAIFAMGAIFFIYTIIKRDTYGNNRFRVKAYEYLLGKNTK